MTKERRPLTIESALELVLDRVDADVAKRETGRTTGYLRSMTDHDSRYQLSCANAVTLDRAYDEATGAGFPIYETMGLLLGIDHAGEPDLSLEAIAGALAKLLKETGEANAAIAHLLLNPDATTCRVAKKEIGEAIATFLSTVSLITGRMPERPP